ncbi:MAG: PIN domain-containing protein [Spirochaetaceae bacterium]|jgi:predicted nucleic acid-binding protein|nr:PIN domain-containing protein [Spirochaetaceae bacterium]
MKTICALVDINIIIDGMAKREPFAKLSHDILTLCAQDKFMGYISAHTIPTAHYILRKQYSAVEVKNMLLYICEILNIAGYTKEQVVDALNNDDFSDFEDCLQMESAQTINADYIITRNTNDFRGSAIPIISAEDFLKLFDDFRK